MKRLDREEFDLIAVGRALITNPAWPDQIRNGQSAELQGFNPASLGELV